ncbi:MAG: flagellar filament capping protein FliD [Firmicutes bacterium]|nr:flagellar filament capping protein FliD [[Eubacterium] siraeum]MCM1488307.1 flagellar filament capping protein FliD [Bacillota bacterium]
MAGSSSVLRMSGMNSGLDTEAIVNALTATTKNKINTNQRKVLKLQAQQDAYRTIIAAFNEFKSKYFDMTNISTCLKSGSLFNGYKSEITGFNGENINGVKISCNTNANPGNYDVQVEQVATQATYKSSAVNGSPLKVNNCVAADGSKDSKNYTMNVTVNGTTKNIVFKGGSSEDDVRDNINQALQDAFGKSSTGNLVSIGTDNKITTTSKTGVTATNPALMSKSRPMDFSNAQTGNNTYTVIANGVTKTVTFSTVDKDYFKEVCYDDGKLREEPPATKADGTEYTAAEKQAYYDKVNLFKEVALNTRGKDVYDNFKSFEEGMNAQDEADCYVDIIRFQREGALAAENDRFKEETKRLMYEDDVKNGVVSDDKNDENYKSFDDYCKTITETDIEAFCTNDEIGRLNYDAHQSEIDRINTLYDDKLDYTDAKEALAKADYNKALKDGTISSKEGDANYKSFEDFKAENTYTDTQAQTYLYGKLSSSAKQLYYEKELYNGNVGVDEEEYIANFTYDEASFNLNKANVENNLGALTVGGAKINAEMDANGKVTVTATDEYNKAVEFTVTQSAKNATKLSNLVTESSAASGGVASQVDTSSTIDELGLTPGSDGKYSFTLNGVNFSFDGSATIRDVMKKVNASDAGVKMTYTTLTNQFTLTSNDYGMNSNITLQDGAGGLMTALGFANRTGTAEDEGNGFTRGQNTILTIDGTTVETESNSYEYDGITMSFTQAATGAHFYSDVQRDYAKPIEVIKEFVKDYNALIDTVNGYLNDKPNSDYYFLTDDDLDEMDLSESKENKWETMAKKGILYHDSAITSIMSKLRSAVYNTVEAADGKNIGLFTLGITTTDNIANRGKLQFDSTIDDEKFEMIFAQYADEFATLFNDTEKGIANQFEAIINSAVKTSGDIKECGILVQKAGVSGTSSDTNNSIYRQIQSLKDTISNLQDRYEQQQDRYWKIYSNMETQLGNINGQSSYISQLTSSLGG